MVREPADLFARPPLAVALPAGLVERRPVTRADFLLVLVGDLGQQVAHAVDRAAPAVGRRPERLDRVDEARRAVGDHRQRRPQAAGGEAATELKPVLFRLALAEADIEQNPLAVAVDAPGAEHALLGARGPDRQVDRVQIERDEFEPRELALPEGSVALAQLGADPGRRRRAHLAEPGRPASNASMRCSISADGGTVRLTV